LRENIYKICNKVIESGLIFLVIFTPLAFGSVHVWAYSLMELTVFILLLTWLLKSLLISGKSKVKSKKKSIFLTLNSQLSFFKTPLNIPLLFFLFLVIFQMIPLPPSALKLLSPNTYCLYQQILPGWPYEQDAGYRMQDTGYRMQDAGYTIHDTRYRIQDTRYRMQDGGFNSTNSTNPMKSMNSWRSLSIYPHSTKDELFKFLAYIGVFFLIVNTVRSKEEIQRLVIAIIIVGAVIAFLGIMQMVSRTDKIYWFWKSHYKTGGYFGPYVNPNHFASYLEMVIPLALGFLISRQKPHFRNKSTSWRYRLATLDTWLSTHALLIFLIVIMITALFFSLSRGGILTFFFSIVLMFNFLLHTRRQQKRRLKLLVSVLSLSILFLIWMGIDPVLKELSTLLNLKTASPERPIAWKDTLRLVKDFPILGIGLGNFQYLFPKYKTITSQSFWTHAHNDYLEMLADTGILGTLFFFGGLLLFLIIVIKKWLERRHPFVRGITLGGTIGCIAILLHSGAEFNLHIPANILLLFIILGLTVATVHLKMRGEKEFSLLPTRTFTLDTKVKQLLIYSLTLVLIICLSVSVIRGYLGARCFQLSKSQNNSMNPMNPSNPNNLFTQSLNYLNKAIVYDPSNAKYHYELGQFYARLFSISWKEGVWELERGKWVFQFKEKTLDYGLKTFDSYYQAVKLQPTNGWYHLCLGWIIDQLSKLATLQSINSKNLVNSAKALQEFNIAVMLDPTNDYLRNYVKKWTSKLSK